MTLFKFRQRSLFFITTLLLLFSVTSVYAQTDTPINIGENKTGEVTAADQPRFTLAVTEAQSISVQVLGITTGFAPTIQVFDPSGVMLQQVANTEALANTEAVVALTAPGLYTIQIGGVNAGVGQFLVSVQPGAALQPAQPLPLGELRAGSVDGQNPRQAYLITGSVSETLLLTVRSDRPIANPVVILRDALTGETLALNGARLAGVRYRIPPAGIEYIVEINHSGAAIAEAYTLCVETESGSTLCPGSTQVAVVPTIISAATPTPTSTTDASFQPVVIPTNGPCAVASANGSVINIRSGPSTDNNVVGRLSPNATAQVIGRLPDSSWYQVNLNGVVGWVSASVVISGGNCSAVQPAQTTSPTATPTTNTTTTATSTATVTVTGTATSTATVTPGPQATLNFSLPAAFGSTSITSGFVPDPFTVGMTAGGPANVAYLGGGCSGHTTSAPSFSVNYTSGAFPTLRFYFIGAGDTTMIINSPSGSYACVDDSFGTVDPTIDFNSPSSGRYDVWIATFGAGQSIGGTLYVTENTGNHP